ncbi:putative membrane protein [Peribacillus deserti]|uniref:Membrane protein n=1 Tax=Peribacillus deserti TaxID=673318 RepID=A0ABS2QKL1_9BACI|nr:PH domain-containing protein [Peribacillus deserti]MBM7693540.1 putative membrane protein [Peribacillus deserti]
MNNKRDHIIEFLYHNYNNIKNQLFPILTFIISFFNAHSKYKPLIFSGFVLVGGVIVVYSFLTWYNKMYSFKEKMIVFSEGVFKKRRNDIPFKNIRSINTSDSLIKRWMGISNLNIEMIGGEKVSFVLSNREIQELKSNIFSGIELKTRGLHSAKFNALEYLLLTTSNIGLFLTSLSIGLWGGGFALDHFAVELGLATEAEKLALEQDTTGMWEKLQQTSWSDVNADVWLGALTFLAVIVVISLLLTSILVYLTYKNFSIKISNKEIEISYGVINKKHFHISHIHIRSIRIIEPLLYRKFGYAQIKADNIGLNDKASRTLFIMPIVKKEKIPLILKDYTPDFTEQIVTMRPDRSTIPIFIFRSVWGVFVTFAALTIITNYAAWGFVLVPLWVIYGYLKWKHSGLHFNDRYITTSFATRLNKTTLITLKKYVESTGVGQSFLSKKTHKADYSFAVYSERLEEVYESDLLDETKKDEFLSYLVMDTS